MKKSLKLTYDKKDLWMPFLLRFRGTREGGVKENASYYIFTQSADGAFEAYPIEDWYNFVPIARFKHLTADEAEEEFVKYIYIFYSI